VAGIVDKRVCAEVDGGFVLFLIGMRVNKPWKFWKWLPVATAMPRMLAELFKQPDLGLLHAESHFGFPNVSVTQYWKSFEHLEAYAKARDAKHLPAWQSFYKTVGMGQGVGIWHETYLVSPGRYEAIYGGMPRFGLGMAGDLVEAVGHRQLARQRMKQAKVAA